MRRSSSTSTSATSPSTPLAPRIAVRAAEHRLPAGLVAALDAHLRAHAAGDRIDEVLDELGRVRAETGWPPLAAPIGQILASQALVHVLVGQPLPDRRGRAARAARAAATAPRRARSTQPSAGRSSCSAGTRKRAHALDLDELREQSRELAASEEDLLLLALFGEDAEPLLRTIRARAAARGDARRRASVDQARAERIREIVRIVQESGVDEITLEEGGMRVSVRRGDERLVAPTAEPPAGATTSRSRCRHLLRSTASYGSRRRWSARSTAASEPGAAPFVEEGDVVEPGQTLCILEAMKLMNEIKADIEGIVRAIHVRNAEPVEYGQLLLELEPLSGRPLDAL